MENNQRVTVMCGKCGAVPCGFCGAALPKAAGDPALGAILGAIAREVQRAEAKHRPMASAHEGHSVLREELDELWDHVKADTGDTSAAEVEAVQIGAMAVRYIRDVVYKRSAPDRSDQPAEFVQGVDW